MSTLLKTNDFRCWLTGSCYFVISLFCVNLCAGDGSGFEIEMESDLEVEILRSRFDGVDGRKHRSQTDALYSVKSEVEMELPHTSRLFVDFDIEKGRDWNLEFDELFLETQLNKFSVAVGRIDLPFIESFTRFDIHDSLIEFGEIKKESIKLEYQWAAGFQNSFYILDSEVDSQPDNDEIDYGINLIYASDKSAFGFGFGYVSDLAEAHDLPIESEFTVGHNPVSAGSFYVTRQSTEWFMGVEGIWALDDFIAEADENRPRALSLEVAYQPSDQWLFSGRLGRSEELKEMPDKQFGLSVTHTYENGITIALELLYEKFSDGFLVANEQDLRRKKTVGLIFKKSLF